MNKIITGIILAMPLAMIALPKTASAFQSFDRPQVEHHESTLIAEARHHRRKWIPPHWEGSGRHRHRVPGHWQNY